MKIDTILVATDFSDDADQALDTACELAKIFGARIVLLHAFTIDLPLAASPLGGPVFLPDGFDIEYRNQAIHKVDQLAKVTEASTGVGVQGVAIQQPAALAIVEQAEQLPAELIVMGTRGLTGLMHVALGSTAERVVRKAACPVLTVKASGAR